MSELKQPMLAASSIPNLKDVEYPCYIQPKLDGIRCIAINGVAYSRKMKPIPNKYIQSKFAEYNLHGFDGELMVHGGFNSVQSSVMSEDGEPDFTFNVYDYWDSVDDYTQRLELLIEQIGYSDAIIKFVDTYVVDNQTEAEDKLQLFIDEGYEGGILRSFKGKYKQGRSTLKEGYLLKLKRFLDDEAVVIGFEERMQNNNVKEIDERGYSKRSSKKAGLVGADTLGSLVVQWNGVTFNVGSGFDDAQRKEVWENKDKYLGKLVTFKYQELTEYNIPRFPTFKGFRSEDDV
jgi:DNA ligase-1